MADNDRKNETDQKTSVLGNQAGGQGQANFEQAQGQQSQQGNPYGSGPEASGTFKDPALQGGAPNAQGQQQAGNLNAQGQGATTDQLGQNKQSYGQSTQHDTTGGQGAGQASQVAQGQTGVLGPNPGQAGGQPSSAATGGPDLSQGLKDQNK